MDPLSTAASGIAVISLTIQLASSVQDIHRFLRGVSGAPKELERLVDLLEQLECILDGIRALHQKQKEQGSIPDMHTAVIRALKTCQSRLELLESIVEKAKKDMNRSSKALKTWASLRLTLKKKDVDEFEGRLEQAMMRLQMAVTMNIAHVQINDTRTTSLVVEVALLRSSLATAVPAANPAAESNLSLMEDRPEAFKPSNMDLAMHPRQRRVVMIAPSHTTLFGTFVYRTISTYRNLTRKSTATSRSEPDKHETVITFVPSFLSRCIELRVRNDYGRISPTLTTYIVVKAADTSWLEEDCDGSPIFRACRLGDIETLRSAFGDQRMSPFMVDEDGRNLLHVITHEAVGHKQPHVCRLLLQIGLDPDYTDWGGNSILAHMPTSTTAENLPALIETLETVVSYGQADLRAMKCSDFLRWLWRYPPEVFDFILKQELAEDHFKSFENRELLSLLGRLLELFGATQSEGWKRIIRKFVRMGVNYHDFSYRTSSLLDHLFVRCKDPVKSRVAADEWLKILSGLGVDVRDYLQMEMRRHPTKPPLVCWQFPRLDYRRRIIFSLEGTPTVYWEWWAHPREPGSLVCSEFGDLSRIEGDDHFFTSNDWPYGRPYWLTCDQCLLSRHNFYFPVDGSNNVERAKVLKRAEDRFERRMQKRATKQRKAMGVGVGVGLGRDSDSGRGRNSDRDNERGLRVPGAWID